MSEKTAVSTSHTENLIRKAKMLSGLKTKQAVVNHALQFYIHHAGHEDSKKESFYQLTKHLAGSLEGPSDLGHNKDYLRGFGE